MRLRGFIVGAALVVCAAGCSGGDGAENDVPDTTDTSYLEITDCRELERLASVEVDRINSSSDGDIVTAATIRFQNIVAHRDSVCG